MKTIALIAAVYLAGLAMIYAGYYGSDRQLCLGRGYDGNVLDFPLEGKCYYESEDGTTVYISVEDVLRSGERAPERYGMGVK